MGSSSGQGYSGPMGAARASPTRFCMPAEDVRGHLHKDTFHAHFPSTTLPSTVSSCSDLDISLPVALQAGKPRSCPTVDES